MANALVKIFQNGDVDTLAAKVGKLEKKRVELTARLKGKDASRRENALAAEEGDPKGKAVFDQANADAAQLRADLDDLGLAIDSANQQLSAARVRVTKDEWQAEVSAQRKDCADRLKAAKDVEDALRALSKGLEIMEDLVVKIEQRHRRLMPGARDVRFVRPFSRENVGQRLAQFGFGIGLKERLPSMGADANTMLPPDASFVQTEAEVQSFYEDLEMPPVDDHADDQADDQAA